MRPYQEEYIANIREIARLTGRRKPEGLTAEEYAVRLRQNEALAREKVRRNMELLRGELFPTLDHLFEQDAGELAALTEFASCLSGSGETPDAGLFRLIHQAFLSLARQQGDRDGVIRELYWLGMGWYWLCNMVVGMELDTVWQYISRMRLCFTEAAAYLKYYDEIADTQTKGYVLRARANMSLGSFHSPGEKIGLARENLRIMQDEAYQSGAPELPWDRFVYTTHQQMASSVSYNKEKVMSPEDMASVMESAYIVYQRRLQEAAEQQEIPPLRWMFPYYAMEYYCGLYGLDRLLSNVERLLDAPEPGDQSSDGMYGILSLPAFYCQYMQQNPERIPGRATYIEGLYRRALAYADSFTPADNEKLFLYFRQLTYTYIETSGGVPFGTFLQMVLLRFAPEVYLHSWITGTACKAVCEMILDEEPDFFDDAEDFHQIAGNEEKRRQILNDAMQSGLLHDIGKISFLELYSRTARQWFEEEYEASRLHTIAGYALLNERESTRPYAPAALGHHGWYDGSGHGYPAQYKRLECPRRQMVDLVGLIDWLEAVTHTAQSYEGIEMTFEEAVSEAIHMEGRQFSPLLTARLRDKRFTERIRQSFEEGRKEAYRQMYVQERGTGQDK